MDIKLIEDGKKYYNLCKENRLNEVDALDFRTWMATSIRSLEKVADESELMKVTDSFNIYSQGIDSITPYQLELLIGLLNAEYEIHQKKVRSVKSFSGFNR